MFITHRFYFQVFRTWQLSEMKPKKSPRLKGKQNWLQTLEEVANVIITLAYPILASWQRGALWEFSAPITW